MHYFRFKRAHMEDSRSFHSDFSSMLQRIKKKMASSQKEYVVK